jgi:lipopolysaccharide heptosyltransferase I
MTSYRRVLIIKLGSIGDVVHTLPAVSALKQAWPETTVDWVVERKARVVLEGNPQIAEIIEVDTHRWRKSPLQGKNWREIRTTLQRLRGKKYDLALDFQGLWKSAALGWFSGARQLAGLDAGALKEPGCRLFYHLKVNPASGNRHVIEIYNDLVRAFGVPVSGYSFPLAVSPEDELWVEAQVESMASAGFAVINPGGGWPTKNWDAANYGRLCHRIHQELELPCVITWGPGEEGLRDLLLENCPPPAPLAIPTTIPQLVALVRRARVFIGGDTGPMHLAAAVGTPIVALFGPTDPIRNGPFHPADEVVYHPLPCGPCYKRSCEAYQARCVREIPEEEIFRAVVKRLGKQSRAS